MIAKFCRFMVMAMVAGCLLLPGCKDDEVNGSLSFSEENLLLKAAGDTMAIAVTAGSDWKAESQADWCTVEKESAEKLIVRVAPSDDVYERGTAVKITCGDNVVRLSVRQEPMLFEILDEKSSLDFNKLAESTDVLKIHTNMAWKVEITDTTGWLQVADTAGLGDAELMFTVSDNSQKAERKTTVRLRYGVRSLKLTATQRGGLRADGHIRQHYGERELEDGYNLIFLSEGFTKDELIEETGVFDQAVEEACEFLFNVEPYKTYKEYFNVFSVSCVSKESGVSSEDEYKNTAFSSLYDSEDASYKVYNRGTAWDYAMKVLGMTEEVLQKNTCVVLLVNDERYGGNTWWYSDGRTLCVVPLNRDTQLPGGFTNIFLHEVGGHGIGKLADAWSNEGGLFTAEGRAILQARQAKYYCYNLGLPTTDRQFGINPHMINPWKVWSYIGNKKSSEVNACDGGLGFVSDREHNIWVAHCDERNCMTDHSTYFDRASRYGIYFRVIRRIPYTSIAEQNEAAELFLANDVATEIPEAQPASDRPRLKQPVWVDLTEEE